MRLDAASSRRGAVTPTPRSLNVAESNVASLGTIEAVIVTTTSVAIAALTDPQLRLAGMKQRR